MSNDKLIDFVEIRKKNIETKRRNFERILFTNVLGVYTVLDKDGIIFPVELVDVSRDGCLLQIAWNNPKNEMIYKSGEEITFRLYFTKQSFMPVIVKVRYGKEFVDKDGRTYMHYGCEFDKSVPSFTALSSFIDFLYKYAEVSSTDKGDAKVFFY
jgi:hypothetical protein